MKPVLIMGSKETGIEYWYTPPDPEGEILFKDKKKSEQFWVRPHIPEILINKDLSQHELDIQKREILRRINGVHMMINGRLEYITGDHYFFLTYWYINADTPDGFPEYREAHRDIFYFLDMCIKDDDCYGAIMTMAKRTAKTEIALCVIYNRMTCGIYRDDIAGIQGLNEKWTKENLWSTRIIRSHQRIPTLIRAADNGDESPNTLNFKPPHKRKGSKTGSMDKKVKGYLMNTIGFRGTKESAYQGMRPRFIYLDEPPTIEEMNILDWWTTVKRQLTLGFKKIYGKAFLFATVEDMKYKSAEDFRHMIYNSNPNERDGNNRTGSGLYLLFQPFYYNSEGFIDKYGKPKIEDAKAFLINELEKKGESEKLKIKRQYPESLDDIFRMQTGRVLESASIDMLENQLEFLSTKNFPVQYCKLILRGGEIEKINIRASSEAEKEESINIFEEPRQGVLYIVGVDGVNTDKRTSEKGNKKSDYAIVVTKLADPLGDREYCEVATYTIRPDKIEEAHRIAWLLSVYYNKYDMCRVMPERNVGVGAGLVSFFDNKGAIRLMRRQPKYIGTDIKQEKDGYGFYRDDAVRDTQISMLNKQIQHYGQHLRSKRLINELLQIGIANVDLADAFMAAIVGWGGFDPEKKVKKPDQLNKQKTRKRIMVGGKVIERWC